jgi:hypothetical protein
MELHSRIESMLLVASLCGRRCLVERIVWPVHQRVLTEHRSHLNYYDGEAVT